MKPARRTQRGFTLIEVLVALAIVAIGMAALMSALTNSAGNIVFLRDKTFAEWVALNQIEEVRLAMQRPQKGEKDGDAELAGRRWKWHQEVLETEVKGIMRIDVRVKPAEVSGDSNWYATVSAITGDALAFPSGVIDYYGRQPSPPGGPGGPGGPGNPRVPNAPGSPPNGGGTVPTPPPDNNPPGLE